MTIHDWTRVEAGIFHAFHHGWIEEISRTLNRGLLPPEYYALPEQVTGRLGPDVLTLRHPGDRGPEAIPGSRAQITTGEGSTGGGLALAAVPPRVRVRLQRDAARYAGKAKAVAVRHVSGHHVVARVEIVSPGNKNSRQGMDAFVRKAREALAQGIHLLLVDLFPPGPRDPQGIHRAVWSDDTAGSEDEDVPPPDKPLTCVAYIGGPAAEAFIEPVAVGDALPEMPLFLTPDVYIPVPLDTTYAAAWAGMPAYWRDVLTGAPGPNGNT